MPRVDLVAETAISRTPRARQLEAMFDVPPGEKARLEWHFDVPLDDRPWNVGLIVGPSGSGKSQVARALFGDAVDVPLRWRGKSVIDDFPAKAPMETITRACQAVGFNTIPAWLRPFDVLSNGEQFRVELARRLVELPDPIVVDEFSSVVDRQVAQIASHAVQRFVRREARRFVAVTCHYDVLDWLQPDWIVEPATGRFAWRSLQRRPAVDVSICRVPRAAWALFAPFHYLSAELHRNARCFGLFADDRLAALAGVMYRPNSQQRRGEPDIYGMSRLVTLPDFQGLGLAFVLADTLGAVVKGLGGRYRAYPAHPTLVRSFARSKKWRLVKAPGSISRRTTGKRAPGSSGFKFGGRPCAIFEYVGEALEREQARAVWARETQAELKPARRRGGSAGR